ncbi:hypothetical protein GGI03_000583 [Coemansia sp. RSA 2337]|nr:hypothetical protein GGI03_000583 [Coemansia sp. RSA 2337]
MHRVPLIQVLPLHIIESIVGHVVGSSRLQFDGVIEGSKGHVSLLLPLLSVCHCFRAVAISCCCWTHTLEIDKVSAKVWVVGSTWLGCLIRSKFPTHLYAKILRIELGEDHIYNGLALKALLRKPYVDYTFPKVRSMCFKFDFARKSEHFADDVTAPQDIGANIRAFVCHIKQIAPMVQKVYIKSTRNISIETRLSSQQFNSLASQICQSICDMEFIYLSRPICMDSSLITIRRLVYMDVNGFEFEPMVHLARHNAPTLQFLNIYLQRNENMTGLIQNADGSYVQYPCLYKLILGTRQCTDSSMGPTFPGALPFPHLRYLSLVLASPIGDDTPFRGNAATLEWLNMYLTLNTITVLRDNMVFTPTSHPRLQSVNLGWNYDLPEPRSASEFEYMKFGLTIGPNAPVRQFTTLMSHPRLGPITTTLGEHKCIQALELTHMRIHILDVIALVKVLPLLSHLCSKALPFDPLPRNIDKHNLPAYVIAKYPPMGKWFRCWRINPDSDFDVKIAVKWALLLVLICPNFDYVAVPANSRKLFMAHMKEMIASNGYRQHATRLRRLLFGGWSNFIPNVKTAQAKRATVAN